MYYVEGTLYKDKLVITSEGNHVRTIHDPKDLDVEDWTSVIYTGGTMQDAVLTIKLKGYDVVRASWSLVHGGMGDRIPIKKEFE